MSESANYDNDQRKSRVTKSTLNVIFGSLLFLAILIGAYWLADKSQQRLDLTRNNMYSLSDSTREMLKKLEDRVTVTVYATGKDTPPEWTQLREELRELLTQYRNVSDGKVQFTVLEVNPGTGSEKTAQDAGMEPEVMQSASANEIKFNQGYLGFTAEYRGKTETVPFLRNQSLEYQLTSSINKAAAVAIPKVGVMAPGGNPLMGQPGQFTLLTAQLEAEGFDIVELQANALGELDDLDMLMLIDPQNLSDEALFKIDQYVMNGGKMMVAAPGVQLSGRSGMEGATPAAPNINSILEHYGVRINENLVEDWQGASTPIGYTQTGTIVRYRNPLMFTTAKVAKDNELAKNIPLTMFAFTSSVGPSDRGTSGTVKALVSSSDNTRLQERSFTLEPTKLIPPTGEDKLKSHDLVILAEGPLRSRYAQEPPPVVTNDDGTTRTIPESEIIKRSKGTPYVVVVGSALLFTNQALSAEGLPTNVLLPLNIVEGLTRGSDHLALRAREISVSQLRKITPTEATVTQALIVVGIPVLLVIFGFGKMMMNRRRKARYRRQYAGTSPE